MNSIKTLALASAAAMLVAGAANATTIYATNVDGSSQPSGVDPARSDTSNALGAPDGSFYSLGLGGSLTVDFGRSFGSPGKAYEITFGGITDTKDNYPESADIYVGNALDSLTLVSSVTNTPSGMSFSFAGGPFTYLKIVDTTKTMFPSSPSNDGYDVDAIGVSAVPLPATGILLMGAFGGLAALRRRNKKA